MAIDVVEHVYQFCHGRVVGRWRVGCCVPVVPNGAFIRAGGGGH